MKSYVPDLGDFVWVDFDPSAGHEQGGHRPGLVLSAASYNGRTGLMIVCPMTSRPKGYPFEVLVTETPLSAVLSDHVKSVDWRARRATFKAKAHPRVVAEVHAKIGALLNYDRRP